ncbi:hypothetical protein KFK09_004257 [Dendrobium nobile]|uniref:Uncharacterized protein n=1 Tax=Dendrobium nobile TaxID=94219 RepID=A0A8T3C597_DENNO|nr:hypothetical protein KFK09_004257 [Dendrobium nobile]
MSSVSFGQLFPLSCVSPSHFSLFVQKKKECAAAFNLFPLKPRGKALRPSVGSFFPEKIGVCYYLINLPLKKRKKKINLPLEFE